MPDRPKLSPESIRQFLVRHRLPPAYEAAIQDFFLPLVEWLGDRRRGSETLVLGINGAQGTGKSTLGDFLALACKELFGWNNVVLSIDDFYLTREERRSLATVRHPLLITRGVPGTHDTALLRQSLDELVALEPGQTAMPPRFDKSIDDRESPPWPSVEGPIDMLVLEGWCVGTRAQSDAELAKPVNALERESDPDGGWRTWVNERLEGDYEELWTRLDALVLLRAPGFDAIYGWRLEQEHKLAERVGADAEGVMSDEEIRAFISHYERLTRHNLALLPDTADVVFDLDESHAVRAASYR